MPRERVSTATLPRVPLEGIQEEEDNDHRRRELESQKARIVAQMVPVTSSVSNLDTLVANIVASNGPKSNASSRPLSTVRSIVGDENVPPTPASAVTVISMAPPPVPEPKLKKSTMAIPVVSTASKNVNAYDVFANTLALAFRNLKAGKLFHDPSTFEFCE